MARAQKTKTPEGEEYVETTDSGDIPDVTLPPVTDEAPVKADATKRAAPVKADTAPAEAPADPPPKANVRYFRVDQGGYILDRGYRTMLRPGKVIDTLNYDPKRLASQGIRLTEIDASERPGNFGSTFDL